MPSRGDRGLRWLEDAARDVRYGLRTLRRSPGFTATAVLSLALGIGANAGIYSLVDQVLLRELSGVHEPGQLVVMNWSGRDFATSYGQGPLLSHPVCRDLQAQDQFFDSVFCRHPAAVYLSTGQQHELVSAELVSGSYFSGLGVRPALGRLIDPSDDRDPGAHPVVVLSHDYWTSVLASAADVVDKPVLVNGHRMTIIGVAPLSFRGVDVGKVPAVWIPVMMKRQATPEWDRLFDRRAAWMHVFARLKPAVTAEQAQAGLQPWFKSMIAADAAQADFSRAPPIQVRQFFASTVEVLPAPQGMSPVLRETLSRPLWVLMGGTVILLLLTASNLAGLLAARGTARTRELTTRMAIGATRGQVIRQVLIETSLISIGGGLLGLVAAPAVSGLLLAFVERDSDLSARLDAGVFVFALIVCLVASGLCALTPIVQIRRLSLAPRAQIGSGGVLFRKLLISGQIAFTLLLLTGAGLFTQTVARLHANAPAEAGHLFVFGIDPQGIGHPDPRARQLMREAQRKLEGVAGVERVAISNIPLLTGGSFARPLTIQEGERRATSNRNVWGLRVSPGFFATLGTRMVDGREFDERDTRAAGDGTDYRSVIVNTSFAKRYFGGRSPVGHHIGIGLGPATIASIEIVGLIEDFSYRSLRVTDSEEHIFFPFWDEGSENGTFYVRVRDEPEQAFALIRAAVAELDPALPITNLTSFDDLIGQSLNSERMVATLSSGFGAVALLISIVGLYGVMAFVAAQRTREIGVRLALGATRSSAVWLVVRDAVKMVVAGVVMAIPAGWALGRVVEAQLFGVQPFDASTIALAGGGLTMVALAAASLPALRAAMLPPMVAIGDQPESMWQAARSKIHRAMHERQHDDDSDVPPVTLINELTGQVRRAGSFSEAMQVALAALRERTGAQSITLLEKASSGDYRGGTVSIPAGGLLVERLRHYPHPLPLSAGDVDAWLRWAKEVKPGHLSEIECLEESGARLAVPLRSHHDIVGVLLLGSSERRDRFSAAEKQMLSGSADIFALMIENARLNARALEQEQVRRDLALAAAVQRRLLPPEAPSTTAVAFAAFTLPARTVGGDYYDFLELGGGRIGVAIADIAGKGIAAALLMSVVQASLRVIATDDHLTAAELAAKLNRFLHQSTAANHYATFFYAELDGERRRLRYVNAGHNPPHLVRQTERGVDIVDLDAGGTVIGLFPDVDYTDAEIDLLPGDLLVAFTDGVPEALNANGEEFGDERLKELLQGAVGKPAENVSMMLATRMQEWIAGTEQHDDLTVVVAVIQ